MLTEEIVLSTIQSIDTKGRFIVPAAANPQKDDKVCIIKEDNLSLKIQSYQLIKERLEKYSKLAENAKNIKSEEEYEKIKNLFALSIVKLAILDEQHRIIIPKETIKEYKFDKTIVVRGAYDHIKLFNSIETEEEYRLRLKQKYGNLV